MEYPDTERRSFTGWLKKVESGGHTAPAPEEKRSFTDWLKTTRRAVETPEPAVPEMPAAVAPEMPRAPAEPEDPKLAPLRSQLWLGSYRQTLPVKEEPLALPPARTIIPSEVTAEAAKGAFERATHPDPQTPYGWDLSGFNQPAAVSSPKLLTAPVTQEKATLALPPARDIIRTDVTADAAKAAFARATHPAPPKPLTAGTSAASTSRLPYSYPSCFLQRS